MNCGTNWLDVGIVAGFFVFMFAVLFVVWAVTR